MIIQRSLSYHTIQEKHSKTNDLFLDTLLPQPQLILLLQLLIDLCSLGWGVSVKLSLHSETLATVMNQVGKSRTTYRLCRILLAKFCLGLDIPVVVVRAIRLLALGGESVCDGALVLYKKC
jgi:hypothetical protein